MKILCIFVFICVFLALEPFVVAQRGGGGGGGGGGGRGGFSGGRSSRSSGPSCPGFGSGLAAAVWTPITIFVFLFLFLECLITCIRKQRVTSKLSKPWIKQFPYEGSFGEQEITYHGFYKQDGEYFYMNNIKITFVDNQFMGSGSDPVGDFKINGAYTNDGVEITKQYTVGTGSSADNFGHEVLINLCPTRNPHSDFPVMIGYYYVPRNRLTGMWIMTAKEGQIASESTLKEVLLNKIYQRPTRRFFTPLGLIVILSLISIIIGGHLFNNFEYDNNLYAPNIVGLPIDTFVNLGLILLICAFRYGFMRKRKWTCGKSLLCYFLILVASILNLAFGIIQMIAGDWVVSKPLYIAANTTTASFPSETIFPTCDFQTYDCVALTYETATGCPLTVFCFSFNAHADSSCYDTAKSISDRLIAVSVLSLLQMILWVLLFWFFYLENRHSDSDNFYFLMKNWNQTLSKKKIRPISDVIREEENVLKN